MIDVDVSELDARLGDARRVYVDTSTCIAYHSSNEHAHVLARHLFSRIADDTDPLNGYMSVVSASEMLVRPLRYVDHHLRLVTEFLQAFPNLHLIDTDFTIAHQAANIRVTTRLALPDSLILGTALLTGCEAIVTNDERWVRRIAPLYREFTWIYLGQ